MSVYQAGILAIAGVLLSLQLKKDKPEYAILLMMAVGMFIFIRMIGILEQMIQEIKGIYEGAHLKIIYFTTILRMIGITYIGEFTSSICKDAGYGTLGNQIEILGKLAILSLSIPIVTSLMETIGDFL